MPWPDLTSYVQPLYAGLSVSLGERSAQQRNRWADIIDVCDDSIDVFINVLRGCPVSAVAEGAVSRGKQRYRFGAVSPSPNVRWEAWSDWLSPCQQASKGGSRWINLAKRRCFCVFFANIVYPHLCFLLVYGTVSFYSYVVRGRRRRSPVLTRKLRSFFIVFSARRPMFISLYKNCNNLFHIHLAMMMLILSENWTPNK